MFSPSKMERKLYSGEYADFNITCKKGAVFPVHKIVLADECDFCRAMFDRSLKVSPLLHQNLHQLIPLVRRRQRESADM